MSFIIHSCMKSQFQEKMPPPSLVKNYQVKQATDLKGFFDLTQVLPTPLDTTGNTDYTFFLQQALEKHAKVIMPNFSVLINKNGLKVPSNRVVFFPEKAWVKFQGPAKEKLNDVLKIYNAENIQLINPKVEGSKYSTIPQEGQWSAGICLLNSRNISITNLRIKNTYGDGLFIGSEDGGFCTNVVVKGGWIDNARRNGLSITSGKNVVVNRLLISNTSGHDPEAGVDVEPSWEKDRIENVVLKNIYTFNNKQAGIAVNMNALNVPTDQEAKTISLTIDGHIDVGSNHAFLTSLNQFENQRKYDAKGWVKVKNTQWNHSKNESFWTTPENHRIQIDFEKIQIDDAQKRLKFKNDVQKKSDLRLR